MLPPVFIMLSYVKVNVKTRNGRFRYNHEMRQTLFGPTLFLLLFWLGACEIRPLDLQEVDVMVDVDQEFELAMGKMAVVRNTNLIIRNEGEGSEYYDDEDGNEVHIHNIKLDINGEAVWLDDAMPEVIVGDYVIQWQPDNRLLITENR